jgi:Concanavalin A-like lectin/glucanases superfamily
MLKQLAARQTGSGWRWMTVSCALACTPLASSNDTYASAGGAAQQGEGAPTEAGGSAGRRPIGEPSPPYSDPGVTLPPGTLPPGNAAGAGSTLDADPPELDAGNGPPPPVDSGQPEDPPLRVCAGSALRLDGATFARFTNPLQDDFTLEAWIKTSASLDGTQHFQGRGVIDADVIGGPNQNDFSATILNGRFAFGVGNPDITIQGSTAVSDDEWVHVAATRRGSTGEMAIFVNGELEASGTSPNRNPLADPETIAIGGGSLVRNFVGLIDEVRLWGIVRSPAAIRASLHEITRADEPGLVAYYRFEDGGAAATQDTSQRGADAALEGAPGYEPSTALCPRPTSTP